MNASTEEIRVRSVSATICDLFEDLLDKHDITIPSSDRTGDEDEARLYGTTYADLEDEVTYILQVICALVKSNPNVVINTEEY